VKSEKVKKLIEFCLPRPSDSQIDSLGLRGCHFYRLTLACEKSFDVARRDSLKARQNVAVNVECETMLDTTFGCTP
jgi:hypothetical protein